MANWIGELLARLQGEPPELLESANKQTEDISRRLTLLEMEQERVRRRVVESHPIVDVIVQVNK
jgi:hypothetical protein